MIKLQSINKSCVLILLMICTIMDLKSQNQRPIDRRIDFNKKLYSVTKVDLLTPDLRPQNNLKLNNREKIHYFNFNHHAAQQLIDNRFPIITIDLGRIISPYQETILDLVDASQSMQSYQLELSSSNKYIRQSNRSIHYRGIIRGKAGFSTVALSIYENGVLGTIIDSDGKSYRVERDIKTESQYIYPNEINYPDIQRCAFNDKEYVNPADYSNVLNSRLQNTVGSNYVNVALETDYDIYQVYESIKHNYDDMPTYLIVEQEVVANFNIVSLIFELENMDIRLSYLKINVSPTSYNASSNASTYLTSFRTNSTILDKGDVSGLITNHNPPIDVSNPTEVAAGLASGIVCQGTQPIFYSNYGLTLRTVGDPNPDPVIPTGSSSWVVLAHELGHTFGSPHTHACQWDVNGDGIAGEAIDGCESIQGNCANPGIPEDSEGNIIGTIMSYCQNVGGGTTWSRIQPTFGSLPRARMIETINNANCLNSCSFTNLTITQNVPSNGSDFKAASGTITASNIINSNAIATYTAGDELVFESGFRVKKNASFMAYLDKYCLSSTQQVSLNTQSYQPLADDNICFQLVVYPNPSKNHLEIDYSYENDRAYELKIYELNGSVVGKYQVSKTNNRIDISHLEDNQYLVILKTDKSILKKLLIVNK